jgi:hypothetical protein
MQRYLEVLEKRKELEGVKLDEWVFEEACNKSTTVEKRLRDDDAADGDGEKKRKRLHEERWVRSPKDHVYRNAVGVGLTLTVSAERYDRLRAGYTGRDFAVDLEALVLRYAPLSKGLQAALPPAVMRQLSEWDVTTECFASPLNSQLEQFCSVFPEDSVFGGAMGSFFEFAPRQVTLFMSRALWMRLLVVAVVVFGFVVVVFW